MCSRQAGHGQPSCDRLAAAARASPLSDRAASAACGSGTSAVPCRPSRVGVAQSKRVDAGAHRVDDVVDVADPQQVARPLVGQAARATTRPPRRICAFSCAERAADRDAVQPAAATSPRRLVAQVLVDPALHDAEQQLALGRVLARARRRSGRASGACARIERCVYSRSTWKGVHSSNASAMSEPSAACTSIEVSGPMNRSRAVDVGAKAHALLVDREDHRLARPRLRLISSATEPWPIENTWKPPESVMIGRRQPMNSCRPPISRMCSWPGLMKRWKVLPSTIS